MIFRESETVELKEVVVDDIKKEIIAFANCNGGKLYIGVQDDGTVVGLDNPDGTALQISNMAVSYTHLDVYKRQPIKWRIHIILFRFQCSACQ